MSLHAPFLVKQYLSSDVESGSYSRIFWYYPLDRDRTSQGGIGLFFEVLSGDVEDDVYEQITKRFWDSFTGSFYQEGFEPSLKKSIKMFIQLLRNFSVEEGLDVNIVLLNVVESPQGYTLKLISFGDSDIFVVRQGKFADMSKMVPTNESLYDLKFLEVELDRGDVLMLGNKTLLRNAFETDMLALTGLDDLLTSLETFKENLFGSKKLFLIAATGDKVEKHKTPSKVFEVAKKSGAKLWEVTRKAGTDVALWGGSLLKKWKKKPEFGISSPIVEEVKPVEPTKQLESENTERADSPDLTHEGAWNETEKPKADISLLVEDLGVLPGEEVSDKQEDEGEEGDAEIIPAITAERKIEPPPIEDSSTSESEPEIIEKSVVDILEVTDMDGEKPDEESHIIEPVTPLPEKPASVEDFIVTSEVTPAMVVEKSEYQGLVDEAAAEENTVPVKSSAVVPPPTKPLSSGHYVSELRARHSAFGKLARHPIIRSVTATISAFFALLLQKILGIFGTQSLVANKKLFLGRPSVIERQKKIQPGWILVFAIVLLVAYFWIRGTLNRNKIEKEQLTQYQTTVAAFSQFYEANILVIDTEDTERQLELCVPEANKVYEKEKTVLEKLKTEKSIATVKTLTSQVQAKVVECQAKYDRIYGIVRVKDAELITDFKVSLGNDSDISAISLRSGGIVVADKGRKSVYQINVDTKSVLKMEDPLGLVVEPLTVGTGEGTLFVCDKVNGVLYYSKNASGNLEGFNRVVGAEPTSIGECAIVEGYAQNAYVVPTTSNVVYRIAGKKDGGFTAPARYITGLFGVRSLSIDGFIYVVSSVDGKGDVKRYYGGKLDSFAMPQSADLGELVASYTNPSAERNLYVYDKTKHAVLSIEKPNSKHPGRGIVEKTYIFEDSDKFSDVRSIAVDLNGRNQEVYMYVLSGTTIWRFRL